MRSGGRSTRNELAESERNPDTLDPLDLLQHVRMMAKNQIHYAAGGHSFSDSPLLRAGLTIVLAHWRVQADGRCSGPRRGE